MTQLALDPDSSGATFSPCRRWRYELHRTWGPDPPALFVGLNPSTADENDDDPTIRRCIRFARDWGHGGLVMANAYAWRSTDPRGLLTADDPVGPDNDTMLAHLAARAGVVVAAWGTKARPPRAERVAAILRSAGPLHVLKLTLHGHPEHPLYVPASTRPQEWKV